MIKFVIIIYSLIISGITSIFNISSVKIDKLEYELYEGSQMQIEYSIFGEDIDISFKSDNEYVVTVNDDGLMHGINTGQAVINVSYNDESVDITVKVFDLSDINEPNIALNTLNYLSLEYEMSNYLYSKMFKNGYNVDMSFDIKSNFIDLSESINMKLLDDYIEITDKESKLVYETDDDIIYEYTVYEDMKKYTSKEIEEEETPDLFDVDSFTDMSLDLSKISINKIGKAYYIQAKYKDLMDNEMFDELFSKYEDSGISFDQLLDEIMFMRIEVGNDSINIDMSLKYEMKVLFFNLPIFMNININLSKEKIKKIDFDDYKHMVGGNIFADREIKVNEEFNINNEVVNVKLEKGYYFIKSTNPEYNDSLKIRISNKNNEYIDKLYTANFKEHNIFSNLYYIDVADNYYLDISSDYYIEIPVIIEKLDYNTNMLTNNHKNLVSSIGEIEGYGDIDYYKLVSSSPINNSDIYMIKNIGNHDITIYTDNLNYNNLFEKITIKPNDSICFEMIGSRDFFITSDDYLYGNGYEYKFKVEKIESKNKYDSVELTKELSNNYYVSGNYYTQKFTFTISERSVFKLKTNYLSNNMTFKYNIYHDGFAVYKYKDNFVLDPGNYTLVIGGSNSKLAIGQIGYELSEVTDDLIDANRPADFRSDMNCTNLGENISLQFNKGYLKYYLTPGQYYFDTDSYMGTYYLYDDKLNEIKLEDNSITSSVDTNTFIIDKEGYYYIYFGYANNNAPLVKADYETLYSETKKLSSSNTGYIEGKYDMDVYPYTLEKNKTYKIVNTSTEDLVLHYIPYARNYESNPSSIRVVLKENEEVCLIGTGRTFNLYITTFEICDDTKYSYSFDFVEIERNTNSEEMDEISFEYTDIKYITGYDLESIKLKLNITELGIYKIESIVEAHSEEFSYGIKTINDEYIEMYDYTNRHYVLPEGEYIVELYSNYSISYGQVKVTKVEDYNIVNVELDLVSQYDNYENQYTNSLDNYPSIENTLFFFEIEEESNIIFKIGYSVYNIKNNVRVNVKFPKYNMCSSTLDKGIYYFRIYQEDKVEYVNYLEIGIVKEEEKQLSILTIGSSYTNESNKYLYDILKDIGYESIKVANLYIDNVTLEDNYNNIMNNNSTYKYVENENGIITINENYNAITAFSERNWDHVIIHGSIDAAERTQYDKLFSYAILLNYYLFDSNLYWYSGWAWSDVTTLKDFEKYGSNDVMLENITENMKIAKNTSFIKNIIPVSTAIKNARISGMTENLITINRNTYNNLSEGIGSYLSSMMIVKTLFNIDLSTIEFYPEIIDIKYKKIIINSVNNAYDSPYTFMKSNY